MDFSDDLGKIDISFTMIDFSPIHVHLSFLTVHNFLDSQKMNRALLPKKNWPVTEMPRRKPLFYLRRSHKDTS